MTEYKSFKYAQPHKGYIYIDIHYIKCLFGKFTYSDMCKKRDIQIYYYISYIHK